MKSLTLLVLTATIPQILASYVCPAMPGMGDMRTLRFAYVIQDLMNQYYASVPVNASFFSSLPMASMTASNGMTLAENTVTNVEGLGKQAMLGSQALKQEWSASYSGSDVPICNYVLPAAPNASAHLMNAFHLEATLCGAFIGLADYFQTPVWNSLSARLAAEHGIHAAAIRGMLQPVGFMPNSTMLTPAFTTEMVVMSGSEVGMLGDYLSGCVLAPTAPCGGTVSFGPLTPTLMDQSSEDNSSCGSNGGATMVSSYSMASPTATVTGSAVTDMSGAASATASGPIATYSGDATKPMGSMSAIVGVGAFFCAWILS